MVRAFDQDATRAPPFGGFPGTSDWEETPRQTQNPLERLYISSGLGTPRDPPGGAGERCWGEGGLESPAEPTASATRPRTSGMTIDGWMEITSNINCLFTLLIAHQ